MTETRRSVIQAMATRVARGRRSLVVLLMLACGGAYLDAGSQATAQGGVAPASSAAAGTYHEGVVTSEGRKIHYLDWGPADMPALVLVHALGHSAHSYDHVAPQLNQRYRVIAIDLRGHGDSDWSPKGEYAVENYVADLHALIEQLQLRRVSLIGCSIGGRVVQVYASMHPDRVSKMISLDVGPARPESTTRTLTERIQREQEGWASKDELLASLRRNPTRTPEAVHRNEVEFETRQLPNGRIVWKFDPKVTNGLGPIELWDYVRRIKAPSLYVVGGRSRLVTVDEQAKLRTLSFAEVVTIPDAGHYPQEDTPEVFLAVVKAFLRG